MSFSLPFRSGSLLALVLGGAIACISAAAARPSPPRPHAEPRPHAATLTTAETTADFAFPRAIAANAQSPDAQSPDAQSADAQPLDAIPDPIRVGVYVNPPKVFWDETGNADGFWIDLLEAIARAEGWTLDYAACEWDRCLEAIERGQLDLMVDVAHSEARDRRFDFNREVVLASWSVVYARPGHDIAAVPDLDGLRVAVLRGSIQNIVLRDLADRFAIAPEFVEASDFDTMFDWLDRGEVDAAVVNRFFGARAARSHRAVRTNLLVYPSRLHFVVAEGQNAALLAAIDRQLRRLEAEADSPYYRALRHWLEPEARLDWQRIRQIALNALIYSALGGMAVLALWNRRLQVEANRRRQAENRLQALADNIPGVIYRYVLNPDGSIDIPYISSGCRDLLEVEPEEIVQDPAAPWRLVCPEDLPAMQASVLASAESLEPWRWEWRIQTPSGKQKYLQAAANPVRQPDGTTVWDGTILDVTERKLAEAALQDSERRFQKLADNVPGIIFGYCLRPDGSDCYTYISSGFRDIYGFPPEEALADVSAVWNLTHPDDLDRLNQSVRESYETLETWQCEYRIVLPDGRVKWLRGISRPTRQPNGDVLWDGIVVDLSDRKQAEDALRDSEQRFRNMAANVPGAIFRYILHPDGRDSVNYMSPGCYRLWEVEAEAVVEDATVLWNMIHPDDRPAVQASVLESARTLAPWFQQWRNQTPSGKLKWFEAAGRPERKDNGDVVWDTLISDVSDRKRAELALQAKYQREQSLSRVFQAIRNSLDLDTIFTTATAETVRLLPGFNCCVVRYFPDRGVWKHAAEFRHGNRPSLVDLEIPDRDNPFAERLKRLQTVRVEDTDTLDDAVNVRLARQMPGAWLLVPLAIDGRIWGSFTLNAWERPFVWTEDCVELAQAIADQLEIAIQQAELYRQVEREKKKLLKSQAALTQAQQVARVGNWELDMAAQQLSASENLLRLLGFAPDAAIPPWPEVLAQRIHPDDRDRVAEGFARVAAEGVPCELDLRFFRADGSTGYLEVRAEAVPGDRGETAKIFGTALDISDRKRSEIALRRSEERLRLVTENMSDLVCLLSPESRFLYVTPSSFSLLGYRPEELIGRSTYELLHPGEVNDLRRDIHEPTRRGRVCRATHRMRRKSGRYIWLESLTKPIYNPAGEVIHLQVTSRDASDRVAVEEQLKHAALHDELTGLPNRNLFMERLDLALKRARRYPTFQFAVLFLDLDRFKVVNDSLGHAIGDELLQSMAQLLSGFIRGTDVAARLGGDEFVILLEAIDSISAAIRVAQRILETLQAPLSVGDREVFFSTSIGIVAGEAQYERPEDLLRDADLAMYRAKQAGRGRYALFDPTMHLQVVQRLHLENDLRKALDNREFVLHYQPIFAIATRQTVGFEALIRWHHPSRGIVSPGTFVEIAEEIGTIVPLGNWVLETACQQLAAWRSQFPRRSPRVSVNLSAQQLQESLLTQLDRLLSRYGIPGDRLVLEITESMLVQNVEETSRLLERIQARGIGISIDDFGTGYSSLNYLHRLPVDSLKIDRGFVSSVEADGRNRAIAESIVALSNLLGLNAIAEGIETEEQLRWLESLGCEFGQGYLISRPLPAEAATAFLQRTAIEVPDRTR